MKYLIETVEDTANKMMYISSVYSSKSDKEQEELRALFKKHTNTLMRVIEAIKIQGIEIPRCYKGRISVAMAMIELSIAQMEGQWNT